MPGEAGREFESVILVGSSGTGKTTLMEGLAVPELRDFVAIPQRCSTRPLRGADNPLETIHLEPEVFKEEVEAGLIWPSWRRNLDIGKAVLYGFRALPASEDRLPIYQANNALLRYRNDELADFVSRGLLTVLTAELPVREQRLRDRGDMNESEIRNRRIEDDLVVIEQPAELIHTAGLTPEQGQEAFRAIIKNVLAFNAQVRSGRFAGSYQDFKIGRTA